ncbi:LOW QUALITY PROTEIN: putative talin [Schistosoma mansoni]|uniref:putative talin n=1 Tax=Schistosoma mansoni TaxID=6183 RepID=UPI00022DC201|nr:LOW QUALITY PROTEIN: putative talin [Schistosoma mansoni]|eukprot:XP_018650130.1 LOW QUALITY PROTEIN: putative talin [Schistosoma mansoni]
MLAVNLLIRFPNSGNCYSLKFTKDITVYDLCHEVQSKIREAACLNPLEYGIFVPDPDPKHSFWLDNSRMLSYYHFCDNFEVQYRCKLRLLVIQTMDETRKTLQVDDSKTVSELMFTICAKIGITNYEEYSLIRPSDEDEKMRTLTLRKGRGSIRNLEKLEKMKQKLHTDDEFNWLAPGKTLRQHGVDESEILLLRRKYFYSDQNIDTRDPVQLNLLYVQLKEAILNGTHPISQDQAINLAALQCQAEYGPMVPEKIKRNPIDLILYRFQVAVVIRTIVHVNSKQYQKLGNYDEREAKLRYVQLCRSLPTYGITFFLIKEKLKGRNKLVPRLFGVSKESVMRVDEKTKEIIETWSLTRIRRWAATANLFTLDFGQYSPDGNYIMQTTEGEQIAQLISGYVDIILRRQRSRDSGQTEGDEENTIIEENIAPSKANVIANMSATLPRGHRAQEANLSHTGLLRTASQRENFNEGHLATESHTISRHNLSGNNNIGSGLIVNSNGDVTPSGKRGFQMIDLGQPKRALLSRIDYGVRTIQGACEDIDKPIYEDEEALYGDDINTKRWRSETLQQARAGVLSHLGAMTMATGRLISGIEISNNRRRNGDMNNHAEIDYASMDASMTSIGMNVKGLMDCVRLYNQLDTVNNDNGSVVDKTSLKQAAQALSDAFLDLMRTTFSSVSLDNSSDKASTLTRSTSSLFDSKSSTDRAALLEAASRVGDASRQLLQLISPPTISECCVSTNENDTVYKENNHVNNASIIDWEARDRLLTLTKSVANAMTGLVKKAKMGALVLDEEVNQYLMENKTNPNDIEVQTLRKAQSNLVHSATRAGKTASQLVTCAKVVACTMEQPESQQQLMHTIKEVAIAADAVPLPAKALLDSSSSGAAATFLTNDHEMFNVHCKLVNDLEEGVYSVHNELDNLLDCLIGTSIQAHQDPVIMNLLSVSHQLPGSVGDGLLLVRKANALASAVECLVADLRSEAMKQDSTLGIPSNEIAKRADVLEKEIYHLLSVAQECADGNAQSLEHQQNVIIAAENLVNTAHATAAPIIRSRLTKGLEFATRLTADNVGPLATVGGEVVRICQNDTYQLASDLEQLQKRVMPQVNLSCNIARVQPYDVKNQANLLAASQNLMKCLEDLLRSADAVAPTIEDSGVQSALTDVTRNTHACLTDLRLCFANSETVLGNEPPDLYHLMNGKKTSQSDGLTESDYHIGDMEANELVKISTAIERLRTELFDPSYHLLPNETLDSICVSLWSAITDYNQVFAFLDDSNNYMNSNNQLEQIWHKFPPLIERIKQTCNNHEGNMKKMMQSRLNIVQELLYHLGPVLRGIRSLARYFHNAAQSTTVDSNLARVINVSHGVASKRQSSISVCSNLIEQNNTNSSLTNSEQQTQMTANFMHQNLMSIAETCLVACGQLITWALRHNSQTTIPDDELQDAGVTADQLNTSINAVLGYIPGEVTVRRLFALLHDASRIVEMSTNETLELTNSQKSDSDQLSSYELSPPAIPMRSSNLPLVDIYEQMSETAKQLARTCLSVSYEVSGKMKPSQIESSFGSHSNLILLACIADRLTSAVADVVRAAGYRSAQLRSIGHLLNNFNQAAEPVAYGLQYAMRTLESSQNDSSIPSANLTLAKSLLKLRDWALELDQKAMLSKEQAFSSRIDDGVEQNDDDDSSQITINNYSNNENEAKLTETFMHMRNQCDVLLHRLDSLIHPNVYNEDKGKSSETADRNSTFCPILLPINDLNYPQCCDTVCDIDKEFNAHLNVIPSSISDNKAGLFIQSVKGLAQVTNHLVQITYQAAYLIAAAHPASRPGHVTRFRSSDQLTTIHDHVAAIRKSVSEICQSQNEASSKELPSLEILATANHLAQRATQLCQTTRPYLSEIKNLSEKRRLADSLEHVARSAASIFNIIKTSRSTNPTSGTTDIIQKLCSASSILEVDVDQYIDLLLRDAAGSPAHLAEETYELTSMEHDLIGLFTKQSVPGLSTCDKIQKTINKLLNDLNHAILSVNNVNQSKRSNPYSSNVQNLESSLALIRTTMEQIENLSKQTIENCQLGNWEIMAHNLYSISTYLPNFVKESIRTCGSLMRLSDQTNLNSLTRTVLEAMQQLIDCVSITLKGRSQSLPVSNCHNSLINYNNQLQQACVELSKQIDTIATEQGGLNWHIASITSACSKYPYQMDHKRMIQMKMLLHCQLTLFNFMRVHQSRELSDLMIRVTEIYAANQGENCAEIISSFVQQFLQMTETVQQMSSVLKMHPQIDTGPALAQKLCHATQAIGAASSDFLRAPLHSDKVNNLNSRLNDLKAVLQSCTRGADACTTAITKLNRLVADLDTAALFARAGTLQESFKSAFQTAQEAVMQAEKGIVEDMQTLIKTTSTDQDALAISAQNCFIRATELTESAKNAASCTASLLSSNPDLSIEGQVQLLTSTRDVISGLVRLLNHGKSISAVCYAIEFWNDQTDDTLNTLMKTKQKALNDTAVQVIETISGLSNALRSVSDMFTVAKSPTVKDENPPISPVPPAVPLKKVSLKVSVQKSTSLDKKTDHTESNVHTSLKSIITILGNLNGRLNKWNVKDGLLHTPDLDDDIEFERETALGQVISPSYLVCAARAITQAATNANNATGSGKTSEIGLAGDMIRRAAEELVRRLHSVLQTSLSSVSVPKYNASRESTNSSNIQEVLSNGVVRESGTENTLDDCSESISYPALEKICQRAIHGSAGTISELKQLVEHMNKALDSGPGSPDSVQVTLAMRRLRETVFEIVDCSMSLPGANEDDIADFKPAVSTKPIPILIDNKVTSSYENPFDRKSIYGSSIDIEKSIAEANATAVDIDHSTLSSSSSTSGVQNALQDLAGEIERSVERIGLLHSKHSFKNSLNSQKSSHSQLDQSKDTMTSTSKCTTTVASTTNNQISNNDSLTTMNNANEDIDLESSDGMDALIIACRNLVHATLSLMYWAAAAQRELVQQGRLKPIDKPQNPDLESESQWAQGLISAARYVAVGANHLVESAQAFVTMHVSGSSQLIDAGDLTLKPESLISAAQTTAGYTAQLVIACIAKADPNSQSCLGLRNAGGSVKHAADRLVRIVQMIVSKSKPVMTTATTTPVNVDKEQSETSLDISNGRVVSSMRQVIETKSSIAAKQRELDKLHAQLKHIHQDQYRSHVQ